MAGRGLEFGIADQFARSYEYFRDLPAVIDGERRLTYGELGRRARQVANALAGLGLRRGERVFMATENRAEFFEVEHGLFAGGYVRVAISARLHAREAAFIINDCRAQIAFVDRHWADALGSMREAMPTLRWVVVFDEPAGEGEVSFESFAGSTSDAPLADPAQPSDLAALLYTSGTTGRPKGAMMLQRTLTAVMRNHLVDLSPVDETDVVLHVGPLAHMSGVFSWCYFARGACHAIMSRFRPAEMLDQIAEYSVTTLFVVPTMLNQLTAEAERVGFESRTLRTVMYGGSAIAPDQLQRAVAIFGNVFVQCYGQSEFQLISSMLRPSHVFDPKAPPRHLASAGRLCPFVEARIIDSEGRPQNPREPGEVVVRSDTVMEGYWEMPEESAKTVDPEGWLRTGDVGFLGDDGYLYLVDRRNDMIVSGGYNVYPREVENAIHGLDGVFEVAVVGAPDDTWGEAVVAVVVPREGATLSEDAIRNWCRTMLAGYKIPKRVLLRKELPKSAVGKILHRDLRNEFWQGRERRVG